MPDPEEHHAPQPSVEPPPEEPNPAAQHMHAGLRHYEQHDLQAAMQEFDAVLAIQPDDAGARFMRGIILRDRQQDDEAEAIFRGLQDHADVAPQALTNLGILARRHDDLTASETYLRDAIARNFQFAPAHYHLALTLLERGHFREGFREYEWRWYTRGFTRFPSHRPRWDGQFLQGTLLVHTEQGTEDTIHFCRYLPIIRRSCQRLILVCSERMGSLLSAPEWADEVCFPGEIAVDSFDAYLPLLSAPLVFQTELATIPAEVPYLSIPRKPRPLDDGSGTDTRLRVALAWDRGPADVEDASRYCTLTDLVPLWQVPHASFYSLQQGSPSVDVARLAATVPALHDLSDRTTDLAELAATLTAFDLVIATDTATAHLAGAMGVPTWTLLSRHSHWRWMRDRDDSPWYPTMRLFRQQGSHEWSDLLQHVAAELARAVDDRDRLRPRPTR